MNKPRYKNIKDLKFDSYYINCPVEIDKGLLLFDNKLNIVLLQMKLKNISQTTISSVYISVDCFDDANDHIGLIEHPYLDTNTQSMASFGDKTPVILDFKTRNIIVKIIKVAMNNGDVWRKPNSEEFTASQQNSLNSLGTGLTKQFYLEINQLESVEKDRLIYLPEQTENIWLCSCGRANYNKTHICSRCGIQKYIIFKITNEEYLSKRIQKSINSLGIDFANQFYREINQLQSVDTDKLIYLPKEIEDIWLCSCGRANNSTIDVCPRCGIEKYIIFKITQDDYLSEKLLEYNSMKEKEIQNEKLLKDKNLKRNKFISVVLSFIILIIMIFGYNINKQKVKELNYINSIKEFEETNYIDGVRKFEEMNYYEAYNYFIKANGYNDTFKYLNSNCYIIQGNWELESVITNSDIDSIINLDRLGIQLEPDKKINIRELIFEWKTDNIISIANGGGVRFKIVSVSNEIGGKLILDYEDDVPYEYNGPNKARLTYVRID